MHAFKCAHGVHTVPACHKPATHASARRHARTHMRAHAPTGTHAWACARVCTQPTPLLHAAHTTITLLLAHVCKHVCVHTRLCTCLCTCLNLESMAILCSHTLSGLGGPYACTHAVQCRRQVVLRARSPRAKLVLAQGGVGMEQWFIRSSLHTSVNTCVCARVYAHV